MRSAMFPSRSATSPVDIEINRAMRRLTLAGSAAVVLLGCEVALEFYAARTIAALQAAMIANDTATIDSLGLRLETMDRYGWVEYGFLLGTLAAFFIAMHGARSAIEWLGIRDWKWSYGWTVGSMFIPFVNFVRPWLGLGEIDRAITVNARQGSIDDGWRKDTSAATLVVAVMIMAGGAVIRVLGRMLDRLPAPRSLADTVEFFDRMQNYLNWINAIHAAILLAIGLYLYRQYANLGILRKALAAKRPA